MVLRQTITRKGRGIAHKSRKWQKMFRYAAEREKAIHQLVVFVHLVHDLTKRSPLSPDWIRDNAGGKIYL